MVQGVSTFRDYAWIDDLVPDEYLVSLIRDATADGVLDALGAFSRRTRGIGFPGFITRSYEFEDLGLKEPMAMCAQTVGVADLGEGWVLMVQTASEYVGVTEELMRPIIDEHEVVSHFCNVNAVSRFVWWRDGECQISFDTLLPDWDLDRAAEQPTAGSRRVLELIEEVGGIAREEGAEPRTEFFHVPGSFALAERLTGVRLTGEVIAGAEFTVALVPTVPESRCAMSHELNSVRHSTASARAYRRANSPPAANNSLAVPVSMIRPSASTATVSAVARVEKRCVTTSVVV